MSTRWTRFGGRWTRPVIAGLLAAIAAAVAFSAAPPARAQGAGWTSPYRLRLSGSRIADLIEAATTGRPYVPGEVLIRFRQGLSAARQQRALSALRSRPAVSSLRWIRGGVAVLRDESEPNALVLADQLRRQPEVVDAEPNYLYRPFAEPNDPGFAEHQWNLRAIDMPRAWDINPGGTDSLIVAVVDGGMTTESQTLTFPTWNGRSIETISVPFKVNPDVDPARYVSSIDLIFWDGPVLDMVGHGTHVASTIGEDANNDLAEAGIAYNVKLMPVKVCIGFWEAQFLMSEDGVPGSPPLDFGTCPDDAVSDGIRYAADNGAKVINLSLGGPGESEILRQAILYAVQKGAFVAMSAGNDFEEGNPVEYPAAYANDIKGAVSVGAVGRSLKRSFFSGTASNVELAAPGGDDRDGGSAGLIWQSTIFQDDSDPFLTTVPRFDRFAEEPFQGTSMAAPHVSGLAALLVSQGVTKPAAIEALLRATARDLGPAGRDAEYGFGLVQPRLALRGFGFVQP